VVRSLVSVALVALCAMGPSGAATPKPLQWTGAQAARSIVTWNPSVFPSFRKLNVKQATCKGVGKASQSRYVSFRCIGGYGTKYSGVTQRPTLWVKVRRTGKGQPCVSTESLDAIAPGCLDTRGLPRVPGSLGDAGRAQRLALQAKYQLSIIWQGPTSCLGYGAGYFECTYEIRNVGTLVAEITLTTGKPVVLLPGAPPTLPTP
jgi:hypothetical protein